MAPQWFKPLNVDFTTDRINHRWIAGIFCVLAVVMAIATNFGNAVSCSAYEGDWEEFLLLPELDEHCLVFYPEYGTFLNNSHFTSIKSHDSYNHLSAYWFVAGLLFLVPHLVWRLILNFVCPVYGSLQQIRTASLGENPTQEVANKFFKMFNEIVDRRPILGRYLLTSFYLLTKLLYVLVSLVNIYLLKFVLQYTWIEFLEFGANLIVDIPHIESGLDSRFPREIACPVFGFRRIDGLSFCENQLLLHSRYIFQALWLCAWVLLGFNLCCLIEALTAVIIRPYRVKHVASYLTFMNQPDIMKEIYVEEYLDGLFLMDLLRELLDAHFTKVVCCKVFKMYIIARLEQIVSTPV